LKHLPLETRDGRLIDVEFVSNVYLVDQEKIVQCNIRDVTSILSPGDLSSMKKWNAPIEGEEFCKLLDAIVIDNANLFYKKLREWGNFYNYRRPIQH
jgi:hypothetical protein